MHAEPNLDFFLVAAMEWDAVRAESPPGSRTYAVATAITRGAGAATSCSSREGTHPSCGNSGRSANPSWVSTSLLVPTYDLSQTRPKRWRWRPTCSTG
jgi:hypothetical protein